mmetsp:Transcript_20451/g.47235  ORF Transcript_20451/g.47235 Transcript_20451/m.47235 type:complete len:311 (-) Transcript_20451:204-1136(-)
MAGASCVHWRKGRHVDACLVHVCRDCWNVHVLLLRQQASAYYDSRDSDCPSHGDCCGCVRSVHLFDLPLHIDGARRHNYRGGPPGGRSPVQRGKRADWIRACYCGGCAVTCLGDTGVHWPLPPFRRHRAAGGVCDAHPDLRQCRQFRAGPLCSLERPRGHRVGAAERRQLNTQQRPHHRDGLGGDDSRHGQRQLGSRHALCGLTRSGRVAVAEGHAAGVSGRRGGFSHARCGGKLARGWGVGTGDGVNFLRGWPRRQYITIGAVPVTSSDVGWWLWCMRERLGVVGPFTPPRARGGCCGDALVQLRAGPY